MEDFRNALRNERHLGRPRQYASNADRQRAYRLRVKSRPAHGDFPLLAKLQWGKWTLSELLWVRDHLDSQASPEVRQAIDAKIMEQS